MNTFTRITLFLFSVILLQAQPPPLSISCPSGTVNASSLKANSTDQEIRIQTSVAQKWRYLHIILRETKQFVGPGALTVSVGRPGTPAELVPPIGLGSTVPQNYWFDRTTTPIGVGTYHVVLHFTAPGGLGNGTVSNFTAGSMTWEACGFTLPETPGTPGLLASVRGVTNTQAKIEYTAPDDKPCKVEVSESKTYLPLAHDVDGALFPGSNLDNRPGNLEPTGRKRVLVLGKRQVATATDGNRVSLALQALTPHFYRITCGEVVASGTFTTANIAAGNTHNEMPQAGPGGTWMIPTFVEDRSSSNTDHKTGALLRRMSIAADKTGGGSNGVFSGYGGMDKRCANKLQSAPDGTKGYACVMWQLDQAYGILYYAIPKTGEVRMLGHVQLPYPSIGDDMSLTCVSNDVGSCAPGSPVSSVWTMKYIGDFTEGPYYAPFSAPVLYSSVPLSTLMHDFDPTFDPALFGCYGTRAGAGGYAGFSCGRGVQDSYAWIGVLSGGDGRPIAPGCKDGAKCPQVVAAMNLYASPATRGCALHTLAGLGDANAIAINVQELKDFSGVYNTGNGGTAAMVSRLLAPIAAGQTSISVSGDPRSLDLTDTFVQSARVGDHFYIGQGKQDSIVIESITAGPGESQVWSVSRANPMAFPADAPVWTACLPGFRLTYWKYLEDPHGVDISNTKVVVDQYWDGGGHATAGIKKIRITEKGNGWAAVLGDILANLNTPISLQIDDSPMFHGARGMAYGSTSAKHPSYHQDEEQAGAEAMLWFIDFLGFDGGNLISPNPGATLISGQLYQYKTTFKLERKLLDTLAVRGGASIIDISGPGSRIGDTAADSFTYCHPVIGGECRDGSAPGDIYVNAPGVDYPYSKGNDGPVPTDRDVSIGNLASWMGGITQIHLGTDSADSVKRSRILSYGNAAGREMFYYPTGKVFADGSWAAFNVGIEQSSNVNVWIVKIPPSWVPDGIDRSTFIPVPVPVPAFPGAVTAAVSFGYAEFRGNCTSRREGCLATSAAIPETGDPFFFPTESPVWLACAAGCSIAVPALSQHMLYYQVIYRDFQNKEISRGPVQVSAIP